MSAAEAAIASRLERVEALLRLTMIELGVEWPGRQAGSSRTEALVRHRSRTRDLLRRGVGIPVRRAYSY